MPGRQLTGFDENFATLTLGVDTLFGGDALAESGADHMIADTWTSGAEPPAIYSSPEAIQLREAGGVKTSENSEAVTALIENHDLRSLPERLREMSSGFDEDRRIYVENQVAAFEVMLGTAASIDAGTELPSYDERYRIATGIEDPCLIDTAPLRGNLRQALSSADYEVSRSRSLRETLLDWKSDNQLSPEKIPERAQLVRTKLLELTREKIFPHLDICVSPGKTVNDFGFDGQEFRMVRKLHFTGSSIYRGRGIRGRRALTSSIVRI